MEKQCTIANEVSLSGVGLHTGNIATITFHPSEEQGVLFRRVDLPQKPIIKAVASNVVSTARGTIIGNGSFTITTIEHIMSALVGLGIDNVLIDVDSNEVPILDGSAGQIVQVLKKAGVRQIDAERDYFEIEKPMSLSVPETNSEFYIEPADSFIVDVEVDYKEVIGFGKYTLNSLSDYENEVASCRTFVFFKDILPLFENGLIKGGDLGNAVVFIEQGTRQTDLDKVMDILGKQRVKIGDRPFLNETGLRFDNEPVRHKMLDLLGDLALVGKPIKGRVRAVRPGHKANTEFAKMLYNCNQF